SDFRKPYDLTRMKRQQVQVAGLRIEGEITVDRYSGRTDQTAKHCFDVGGFPAGRETLGAPAAGSTAVRIAPPFELAPCRAWRRRGLPLRSRVLRRRWR